MWSTRQHYHHYRYHCGQHELRAVTVLGRRLAVKNTMLVETDWGQFPAQPALMQYYPIEHS